MINIKGLQLASEPMWRHTTFLVGGPADLYTVPEDENDLRTLFSVLRERKLGVFILGGGSNILVPDEGIRGVVIDTRCFNEYRIDETLLVAGSGLSVSDTAWKAGSEGFGGLDFLFGMPGTVGGAVWMNARCYEAEIADSLAWVEAMNRDGEVHRLPFVSGEWDYKISPFQNGEWTILRAAFTMRRNDPEKLRLAMTERRNDRESKGHYRSPCAGSAFKNNRAFGVPSGVLIDRCGLKGFRVGGASVSPWHGNILINDRGAEARDISRLLVEVADRVEAVTGFRMEPEIIEVGLRPGG